MERIDRLGWADGFAFSSFGVRIGIRVNQPNRCGSFAEVLPPGHRPCSSNKVQRLYSLVLEGEHRAGGIGRLNLLYDGAQRVARDAELAPVLKILQAQIRRAVAEMAPRRVFVHAGVVEHGGRAIIIPGASMSGKSTLVSELIKLGATYYSDEFAVLDEMGRVIPFAKPLSLRPPGSYAAIDYDIGRFGATVGVRPIPVGLVAVTHFVAGARWRPRRLSAGQGTLEMLGHTMVAQREPGRVLQTLHRALRKAEVRKGARGEASAVAEQMLEEMGHATDASSVAAGISASNTD